MAKKVSELTHGKLIRQMQHYALHISDFVGYQPPNVMDEVTAVRDLVQNLVQSNGNEAEALIKHSLAARERKAAFSTDEFSVKKVLAHISTAILATEGKDSDAYELINAKIIAMRGGKRKPAPKKKAADTTKAAADNTAAPADNTTVPTDITDTGPADVPNTDPKKEDVPKDGQKKDDAPKAVRKISRAQLSYASLTDAFRDLIKMLSNLPYQPYLPQLQLPQLEAFAQRLTDLNDQVDKQLGALNTSRRQRNEYFEQAKASCVRIKSYVKARYGKKSNEYALIDQPS